MARAYVYDMVDTWNAGATTFTAIKMNVTDTASAAGSLLLDLQVGGSSKFSVSKGGGITASSGGFVVKGATGQTFTWSGGLIGFSSDAAVSQTSSADTILARDAANTLAQRNSTNAQTFRLYDTYTDVSNYRRLAFSAGAIYAESAGSGGNFSAEFGTGSGNSGSTYLRTNNTRRWQVDGSGHFLAGADNTYDIGASGANRPRNIYMASWIRMATTTVAALPAAATAGAGARMFVTDALAPVFGSAVAGGGAVVVPVYSTGTAWNVG